jgi:outer membrane protein assembly factor BamB
LQLATDEAFADIVFDEAVVGTQHVVKSLPGGRYFWRVAPAVGETGNFSIPAPVEPTGATVDETNVIVASSNAGWRTATGEVARPTPAQLRTGQGFDLLGVNTDGTIFALDGTNGVALWTARFRTDLQRGAEAGNAGAPLTPVVLSAAAGTATVIVGYDGGIRGLRGDTGREVWRAKLAGRATSATAADADGDGKTEIVAVTADPAALYVLDGEAGRVISQTTLDANPFGAPALIVRQQDRGFLVALSDGRLELRSAGGSLIQTTKFDSALTTPPLALMTPRGQIIVIGTDAGIVALKEADLSPLGRISTRDDAPRGLLTAADLDADGALELIVVTKGGRVAVVSTIDGNTKWFADGATDAASASVADLNGDGVLDVIVPAGAAFARGFNGRDGSLIWRVEEEVGRRETAPSTPFAPRSLVVAPSGDSGGRIVGSDPARTGLRAVELPKGSVKTASK